MNRVALVMMYSGSEPSNCIKNKISELLLTTRTSDGSSDIDMYFFNEEEVAEHLIPVENSVISEHFRKDERTPEEHAVIYIGTVYANSIRTGNFAYDLLTECLNILRERKTDSRLIDAMKIIVKDFSLSRVSDEIRSKYHFGLEEWKVVCKIWETCQKLQGE